MNKIILKNNVGIFQQKILIFLPYSTFMSSAYCLNFHPRRSCVFVENFLNVTIFLHPRYNFIACDIQNFINENEMNIENSLIKHENKIPLHQHAFSSIKLYS